MRVRCPHAGCSSVIQVQAEQQGTTVACPQCRQPILVPLAQRETNGDQGKDTPGAFTPIAPRPGGVPTTIGRFRVQAKLGHGAFGTVYRAHDPKLDRDVAIKVPLPGSLDDPDRLKRFLREARAAAQLRHPNIVPLFETGGEPPDLYLVSAFIDGKTLDDVLTEQKLDFRTIATIVRDLAGALAYAHGQVIIHRDVKPANVMIDVRGQPHLLDFGLAHRHEGEERQTQEGSLLGTPAYMAPELVTHPEAGAKPAIDQYALGVLLYEMLTGQTPFGGPPEVVLFNAVHTPTPSPRKVRADVPRDLETICLKCMEKEPAKRYADCQALADDLRRWLDGEPVLARPPGLGERLVKWAKRSPSVAGLVATIVLLTLLGAGLVTWQWQTAVAALAEVRREKAQRIIAQVNTLREAAPQAVPTLLEELAASRVDVLPHLRQRFGEEKARANRMRLALGLLPSEPETVRDELAAWMLEADDPAEVLLVRDALAPHGEALRQGLWRRGATSERSRERFRALVALAAFDPASSRWQKSAPGVIDELLTSNPLHLGTWVQALRPVRQALIAPLSEVFRGKRLEKSRQVAAIVLADYASDRPTELAELLLDADAEQYAVLRPVLARHREAALQSLQQEFIRKPEISHPARERQARRQATAAATLLHLGQPEKSWSLLQHRPDPTARSYLVQRLNLLDVDPRLLVKRLEAEKDVSARRALILALGEYTARELPADVQAGVVALLLKWYRDDPDAGIHGAIDWLMRHGKEGPVARPLDWGQSKELERIDSELAAQARVKRLAWAAGRVAGLAEGGLPVGLAGLLCLPPEKIDGKTPFWLVNGQGMTLTVVPSPVTFLMGSPDTEPNRHSDEGQHRRTIGRSFAIATKAVTVRQWQQFLADRPGVPRMNVQMYSPEADCPMVAVNWYDAAMYCNWLSKKEGIGREEWVYPEKIGEGMKPLPGHLSRKGYRLATEAEWEFACRAGATSSRYYGSALDLLPRYAWFLTNSQDRTWPVGQKRPNDLGLFDMHGNSWTWCQEAYGLYPRFNPAQDKEDIKDLKDSLSRVLRGASFLIHAPLVRASLRFIYRPSARDASLGLRVARTYP